MTEQDKGHMQTFYLVLLQKEEEEITMDTVAIAQELMDSKILSDPKTTRICVLIESPGGDPHAAYKLAIELRHRCSKLIVIVPNRAKSAATLLALAADEIYMAPASELGPLDMQITHPSKEHITVSALDVMESVKELANTALASINNDDIDFAASVGLSRIGAIHTIYRFTARLFQSTAAKLDPNLIHQASKQLEIAEEYARRLISRRNNISESDLSEQDEELIGTLVYDYPDHGFVICRDEARDLRLPVRNSEDFAQWGRCRALHRSQRDCTSGFFAVMSEAEMDASDDGKEVMR